MIERITNWKIWKCHSNPHSISFLWVFEFVKKLKKWPFYWPWTEILENLTLCSVLGMGPTVDDRVLRPSFGIHKFTTMNKRFRFSGTSYRFPSSAQVRSCLTNNVLNTFQEPYPVTIFKLWQWPKSSKNWDGNTCR